MTVALKIFKGFGAADAVAQGITAATIRQHIRIVSTHLPPKPITPTYPDFGVPVADANKPLLLAINQYIASMRAYHANPDGLPPQHAINIGVASGKTEEILRAIRKAITDGLTGVIFAPTHKLAADMEQRINNIAGSPVCRVWYGIERDDPTAPGQTMCRIAEDAVKWQVIGDLQTLCKACPFKPADGKKASECCGYQRQKMDRTQTLWILTSNMLEHSKPSNILPPSFIICDENPTQNLLAGLDSNYPITSAELLEHRTFPLRKGDDMAVNGAVSGDVLGRTREALFSTTEWGAFKRENWAGVNVERARDMARLEWYLKPELPKFTFDEIGTEAFKTACEQVAKLRSVINKRWRFWTLLADFLESGQAESPNLTVTNEHNILMAWRKPIHADWSKAPTLLLDATLNESIARQWFTRLEVTANIKLEAPYCARTQLINIPVAARQWNPNPKADNYSTQKNNADSLAHWLEVMEATFRGQGAEVECDDGITRAYDIVVVGQKRLIDYLRETHGARLGERVAFEHQNNIRGVDKYKGVRCLILVGRLEPPPGAVEQQAGVIFGKLPEAIPFDEDRKRQYPEMKRYLRMKDGIAQEVTNHVHPDPNAQAVLESICHAELLQCEGRARANRRTADNPLDVFILTNVCLDLTIDHAVDHKQLLAQGTGFRLMQARGIVPEGWAEIATILGKPNADAARVWFADHPEESVMMNSFLAGTNTEVSPIGTNIGETSGFDGWNRYPVRRAGCRKKAWVWIRGDDPAGVVKTFLGDGYTLLADAVPVASPLRSEPEPSAQVDVPSPPDPLPTPANDIVIMAANDSDMGDHEPIATLSFWQAVPT